MEPEIHIPPQRPLMGAVLMLVTGVLFVGVTAIVKHIGSDLPPAQTGFLRYLMGTIILIPMMRPLFNARLQKRQIGLFGCRGVAHSIGVVLWFFAMTKIPIADVTALNYTSPIYVTIGAALFLGERLAFRRIMAILFALLGALIILRPGFREISIGHIAMLVAAVLFAGSYLIAKMMADEMNPIIVVAMLSITVTIGLAPFAIAQWVAPTLIQLFWLLMVALIATLGHYLMTLAFRAAPLTVTQPLTFLQLIWAAILGAVQFGEQIDGWVVLGGLITMGSVSFITWREAVLKRRSITPSPVATKL